ncbi:hypothetical protein GGR58DRAFT_254865 [Xylaria digitata]|nr:hypothetical protein GGR58DRAFT_254865 [Xylaria digitata]
MCRYWALRFPCGCASWRSSGYEFCDKRGSQECKVSLRRYTWSTFCPQGRKILRGRKYTPGTKLPSCCDKLSENDRKNLCGKCNSEPKYSASSPTLWHCPPHLKLVEERQDVPREEAEVFFEKAVVLWPLDHQRRYFRRKDDKVVKGVWWSY